MRVARGRGFEPRRCKVFFQLKGFFAKSSVHINRRCSRHCPNRKYPRFPPLRDHGALYKWRIYPEIEELRISTLQGTRACIIIGLPLPEVLKWKLSTHTCFRKALSRVSICGKAHWWQTGGQYPPGRNSLQRIRNGLPERQSGDQKYYSGSP